MKIIKQFDESDCGAACLAMILNHYGSNISITKIRELAFTDQKGTNLKGLVTAGNKLGFASKAVKGTEKILSKEFPVPFIAHIVYENNNSHYVVIYKIKKDLVYVADPALGFVTYKKGKFLSIWSGYLILLNPTPDFVIEKNENHLGKFLTLIKPHLKLIILMFFVSILLSFFGILTGLYLKFFIDDIVGVKSKINLHVLSFALVFITLFSNILTVLRSQFLRLFTMKTNISLSLSYIKHILHLPIKFFDSRKIGEILSRFDDSEKIRSTLSSVALSSIMDFIMMLFVGVYLFFTNTKLFLILFLSVPISSFVVFVTSKFFEKNYKLQMETSAEIHSYLVELISGISVIKSMNVQNFMYEKYEKKLINFIDLTQLAWNYGNIKELITNFLSGFAGNLVFWIGGYLILNENLTLGQLISFNTLASYFTMPFARFIEMYPSLQEAIVAANRIGEILDLEVEKSNETSLVFDENISSIKFNNITFGYGSRKKVFKDFSFYTKNAKKIAFVGESGCGKSTIMKLLLKFYNVDNGDIFLGENNIKNIDTFQLRNLIGYVPQDIYLFSGTIYENILMGRQDFSFQDVINASRQAQADKFIEKLPDSYNTVISEGGDSLSGGEKQRIALARALLSNPKIMLLDEATSALDTVNERDFQQIIENFNSNIITITIAHRLTTIMNSELIFVLKNGEIIEEGTHDELLKKNGYYFDLWNK